MLKLTNIRKDYLLGGGASVTALKNVNLRFRKSEFVSILGPSGCGKTTLLNIIGGLDRYTDGDLEIDGISTKQYTDVDWDAYRNIRVGFIFQSYNLITHIDILSNVEMALTLAGVKKHERKARAIAALEAVGLGEHIHKKPNQLSGGQMQRVSIARALINNPSIILADEPTGALDSNTSVQIMELLKEISANKLIIMVTHNPELAQKYSNRIVRLFDGEVVDDTNPYYGQIEKKHHEDEAQAVEETSDKKSKSKSKSKNKTLQAEVQQEQNADEVTCDSEPQPELLAVSPEQSAKNKVDFIKHKSKKHRKMMLKKTSMSFWSAIKLSFTNLMTKKGRTFMTAFAGSIGIIGVALVLAISNGFSTYVNNMQRTMLSGYPVTVTSSSMDITSLINVTMGTSNKPKFPVDETVYSQDILSAFAQMIHTNNITEEYIDYLDEKNKSWKDNGYIDSLYYKYGYGYTVYNSKGQNVGKTFDINNIGGSLGDGTDDFLNSVNWQEMVGDKEYMLKNFDVIGGRYPENANEVVLIVDSTNTVTSTFFNALGFKYGEDGVTKGQISFDYIIGNADKGIEPAKLYIPSNNQKYKKITNSETGKEYFTEKTFGEIGSLEGMREITIVGIMRQKETSAYAPMMAGVTYTQDLTKEILAECSESEIVKFQKEHSDYSCLTGKEFTSDDINMGDVEDLESLDGLLSLLTPSGNYSSVMQQIGGSNLPSMISFYASNFDGKDYILADLDAWNIEHKEDNEIRYVDSAEMIIGMMNQIIKIITIALVCFSSVSLVVSSIMIGIITYVSVVERTKEIGILRALGARKRDVSNVFNAETFIIGFTAGVIGVLVTYILSIPINLIIANLDAVKNLSVTITSIALLNPLHALALIVLSICLTLIAGLVPAKIAAKRDPVVALRSE